MGPNGWWKRFLDWRRRKNQRFTDMPHWYADTIPFVGWFAAPEPELEPGELRVLAGFASLNRGWWDSWRVGSGSIWLTDRRLIFRHQRLKTIPFSPRSLDFRLQEITLVRVRSRLRSLFGTPFMRYLEIRTRARKTYFLQLMKADIWFEELSRRIGSTPAVEP